MLKVTLATQLSASFNIKTGEDETNASNIKSNRLLEEPGKLNFIKSGVTSIQKEINEDVIGTWTAENVETA